LLSSRTVSTRDAKKIQTLIKQSKLKVQAAIQGDTVRVTGAKRDDLQAAMALIRKDVADAPLHVHELPGLTACDALPARRCSRWLRARRVRKSSR
jgi:hypothetical protein